MEELNWLDNRGKHNAASGADVLVTVSKKHGNGTGKLYLTFYHEAEKRVSDTGYITIAIRGSRIYMKSTTVSSGWTLSDSGSKGKSKLAQITIPEKDYFFIQDRAGSYILFKDPSLNLYYVDLQEKR